MATPLKCFYKGNDTDFTVFVGSEEGVQTYLKNPTPSLLPSTVELFTIFSNRDARGSEGELGEASKAQLENEFGKDKSEEEMIDIILREGKILGSSKLNKRNYASTNEANRGM